MSGVTTLLTTCVNQFDNLVLRGRTFSSDDLDVVKGCVCEYYELGRTRISQEICKRLDWRQPNGWPKDRACREALRKLHDLKFIHLPDSKVKKTAGKAKISSSSSSLYKDVAVLRDNEAGVIDFELDLVKGNAAETLWNQLVSIHHYLGHQVTVGRALKYIIRTGSKVIGAIGFSSPAWHLKARDYLLGKLDMSKSDIHNYVINNSRFLILPSVKEKNLASRILSYAVNRVAQDWVRYYSIKPKFVETFVQPSKFKGTCYKAANWLSIGDTHGYAKRGSSYRNSQEAKLIFLYGVSRANRKQLGTALATLPDALRCPVVKKANNV